MYSRISSTWVQDASLESRKPRLAEIARPEAQMPRNPASSASLAERPLWASIRKDRVGETISSRSAVVDLTALPRSARGRDRPGRRAILFMDPFHHPLATR